MEISWGGKGLILGKYLSNKGGRGRNREIPHTQVTQQGCAFQPKRGEKNTCTHLTYSHCGGGKGRGGRFIGEKERKKEEVGDVWVYFCRGKGSYNKKKRKI